MPSALAGVSVVVATIGVTSAALIAARSTGTTVNDPWILASVMLFGIAGGVLLVRRPGHRVAWVLSIVGIGGSLAALGAGLGSGDSVADALVENSFLDAGPLRLVGIAFGNAGWWMFVVGVIGLLPLLFPTGDVPSPRWRPVLWTLTAALALMVLLGVATPELCQFTDSAGLETGDEVCVDNPIGVPGLPPAEVGILVAFPASLAAIAGLVLRFRRSDGVERAQLKWLSFALVMLLVLSMGEAVLEGVGSNLTANLGFFDPLGIALVMVPVSIVVAVTRYRLFEIDRLISRTVSYAVVLLVLAAVFALLVLVPTALLGGRETPSWTVAGATLAAAG
ncbi:MAG TPA: hypothetical protein VLD62_01730, partial [Acidimicrobiia bacterium]|nr:hypothetical protein [Acidimicrobiia bacterium]